METINNTNQQTAQGYWYEIADNGRTLVCFRVKIHGKRKVQKLELPNGVRELQPRTAIEK